jgi:outer membrane protein
MRKARRLAMTTLLAVGILSSLAAQNTPSQADTPTTAKTPAQWDLQSCIDYALKQNITIRKSRVNALNAQVDVLSSKAALFPSLSFSASQDISYSPYREGTTVIVDSEPKTINKKTNATGRYGLSANWTLYNGNKRLNTIKQDKINNEIANLEVSSSENDIQQSVAQAYIQILYADESVKVNQNTLQLSIAQRDRGKQMLDAGSISKSDMAQLEAQVSNDRYQLVTAQTTLDNYKLQLKQLLQLNSQDEMAVYIPALSDANVLSPLPSKREAYTAALATRPEIQASKLTLQAAELGINIARSGYIPTISLNAGINTNGTIGSKDDKGNNIAYSQQLKSTWSNSIGITVSMPIFDNRQTKTAIQRAKLQRMTDMLSMVDAENTLYQTVEGMWLDAHSAQQRYAAAVEKLKSAQISYDLVSQQFNEGMKNTVDLLTEKNNLLQAQQEQLQAKYMAILNAQLLKFYEGEKLTI